MFDRMSQSLLLTEGVQAGQDLRVVIMVQTNAADQELLVYLPDHRAGAAGLTLSHSDGHSKWAEGPLNLHTQGQRNRRKVKESLQEMFRQGEVGVSARLQHEQKE